jgi:hypothetical protein
MDQYAGLILSDLFCLCFYRREREGGEKKHYKLVIHHTRIGACIFFSGGPVFFLFPYISPCQRIDTFLTAQEIGFLLSNASVRTEVVAKCVHCGDCGSTTEKKTYKRSFSLKARSGSAANKNTIH